MLGYEEEWEGRVKESLFCRCGRLVLCLGARLRLAMGHAIYEVYMIGMIMIVGHDNDTVLLTLSSPALHSFAIRACCASMAQA
jgi:hypothetical protein